VVELARKELAADLKTEGRWTDDIKYGVKR
jgi:hypothetical protein